MTGYLKLDVIDGGDESCNMVHNMVQGDVELREVGNVDKAMLLDAFMQCLGMSDEDVLMALFVRASGMIDGISTGVSFDMDTLKKMRDIKDGGEQDV